MSRYYKALYGAVAAALGAVATALEQGNGHIGWQAGVTIAITALSALGVIFGVPNSSPSSSG